MAFIRPPVCSPYRLIWALFGPRTRPVDYIYYAYAQHVWRKLTLVNYAGLLLILTCWPLVFIGTWLRFSARAGPKVKRLTGKSLWRQTAEQLALALRLSVSPEKYYNFDLYVDEKRAQADELIVRFVFKGGVHSVIAEWQRQTMRQSERTKVLLNDKFRFDAYCWSHGVASIGSVCNASAAGDIAWAEGTLGQLPPQDLFIKPTKGKGGRGCERWDFAGGGRYRRFPTGEEADEARMLARLRELARQQPFLIQPRAINHPELRDLCGAALSSMRMMSIRAPAGAFEVLFAVFKISGQGHSIVDNFHAGGWVCQVDMDTGALGSASDWGIQEPGRWLEYHPVTGARITGRVLPLWHDTVELVRRAHAAFADRVAVGWDVAITDQGPRIIEGNGQFGLDMVQRTHRVPVGNSRFCELYAWHIGQVLKERWGLPEFRLP